MLTLADACRSISDLVMPRTCTICGRPLNLKEEVICLSCLSDLPLTHFSEYNHNPMADAFNGRIDEEDSGRYCYAAALVHYRKGSRYVSIPRKLKYGRDFREGRFFASMLGKELAASPHFRDIDLVVPVPLHWYRKWRRGYNQATIIALQVAKYLTEARVEERLIKRIRNTSTQTALDIEEKKLNVSGAFVARRRGKIPAAAHILIVDDVFTSGATAAECYRALRSIYGEGTRISVATLAFAGD